jgi:hypothetical protein
MRHSKNFVKISLVKNFLRHSKNFVKLLISHKSLKNTVKVDTRSNTLCVYRGQMPQLYLVQTTSTSATVIKLSVLMCLVTLVEV